MTNLCGLCEGLPLDVVLAGHDLGLEHRADQDEGNEEGADEAKLPLVVDAGADGQQDGEDRLHHGAESTPCGLHVTKWKDSQTKAWSIPRPRHCQNLTRQ